MGVRELWSARRIRPLTPAAGMLAVSELVDRLGVVSALDAGIGPIKERARGLSGGQLLVALAGAQLLGQDVLVGLDRVRADTAGMVLSAVPTPPSTTAGSLARRFGPGQLAGVEAGLARLVDRWLGLLPARLRSPLQLRPPTIDLDCTEVQVYGRAKDGVAYNYLGSGPDGRIWPRGPRPGCRWRRTCWPGTRTCAHAARTY